jgi:hypothetical protein
MVLQENVKLANLIPDAAPGQAWHTILLKNPPKVFVIIN